MTKIVVSTSQGGLESQVSSVFGRCQSFTIVNAEEDEIKEIEVIQNQSKNAPGGAGVQAAGMVANKGVNAVISGNFGPNVVSVLNQAEVKMFQASGMTVKEAARKYLDNELQSVDQATSPAKSGMGGGQRRREQ